MTPLTSPKRDFFQFGESLRKIFSSSSSSSSSSSASHFSRSQSNFSERGGRVRKRLPSSPLLKGPSTRKNLFSLSPAWFVCLCEEGSFARSFMAVLPPHTFSEKGIIVVGCVKKKLFFWCVCVCVCNEWHLKKSSWEDLLLSFMGGEMFFKVRRTSFFKRPNFSPSAPLGKMKETPGKKE